jgi:hypothetical protein
MGAPVASPHSVTTLSDVGKQLARKLTLECRPRCTVRTFNSSYSAGLGALYGRVNI